MDEWNDDTTSNCSIGALMPCYLKMTSPAIYTKTFQGIIRNKIWQVDALLITEAVLAIIIVGVGAFGQHYRHHPFTRFIFLGATTLFLPIVSSVVSTISNSTNPSYVKIFAYDDYLDPLGLSALVAQCDAFIHIMLLVIWALLVQTVMVNTCTVAATEGREGRCKGPPIDLIIQGLWTLYLGFTFEGHDLAVYQSYYALFVYFIAPFVPLCSKIVLKYYAYEKARWSFALGRNPGLTFVYMENLQIREAGQQSQPRGSSNPPPPPPLLVTGEEEKQVVIQSRGYAFKDNSGTGVTFDRIWHLDSSTHRIITPKLKGLCLSFALFKLLRCRFARYKLSNAGPMGTRTLTFFRSFLLESGNHDMIFEVIAQELSFVHDYYYSSLPICYAKGWLPIFSILLSLLTIGYCIYLVVTFGQSLQDSSWDWDRQLECNIWWIHNRLVSNFTDYSTGRFYIDLVLLLLLALLVLIAEVKDTVSYICCNWTKVFLVCRYVNHASSQHSLGVQKWVISFLLRRRCKLIMKEHWNEEMSQCSILVLHHRTALPSFVRRLLPLPDQKWEVKVTAAVKICLINALESVVKRGLSKGVSSLRRNQVGERFLSACNGKGTSETVLIWHIATCIIQVKHHSGEASDSDDNKTVATQLSQYCAYLVSWCPELLPDNSAWSTSLYKAVKKDAEGALAGYSMVAETSRVADHSMAEEAESSTAADHVLPAEAESSTVADQSVAAKAESNTVADHVVLAEAESSMVADQSVAAEAESNTAADHVVQAEAESSTVADQSSTQEDGYQKLVSLLSKNSKHEVVKDSVKLGKQLVEAIEDQETMWKLLAEFWSEMILYLAPSDNLKGHSEAIARGGELITLLWALLFHAGIESRPGEDDGAATSAGVV